MDLKRNDGQRFCGTKTGLREMPEIVNREGCSCTRKADVFDTLLRLSQQAKNQSTAQD
ncbi:uncharacterized protein ARMOST_18446 [Armillaria ostoyae]|uniref:Uncharacterized protein n=1 Tax=Armillaria ostoyae TaxID=47428 RepID=A0A284S1U7_ARMOS|nr:uncharacterized protein ARMOST_18446 [Armillaria ostoyae]